MSFFDIYIDTYRCWKRAMFDFIIIIITNEG